MLNINTHSLKINLDDLQKASIATSDWPLNCGWRTDIYYDMETGEVWAEDLDENSIMSYNKRSVIKACGTTKHRSQQWIADQIAEAAAIEREYGGAV